MPEADLAPSRRDLGPSVLIDQLAQVLLGKREQIEVVLAAALGGGHVLLQDAPGVGKTTLARAVAASLGGSFGRVQGTSDLLPTDITGVSIYDQGSAEWVFHAGPLVHNVVLVDELNRMSPRTQSALLESMAEGQLTVDGAVRGLPNPFLVIATMNPLGHTGTFPLASGQLDRFAVSVSFGLPDRESEREVLARTSRPPALDGLSPLVSPDAFASMQRRVAGLHVAPVIVDYILDIVANARVHGWLSPRASQTLLGTARGLAMVRNRMHVTPDDVQAVAAAVLAHRLMTDNGDWTVAQDQVATVLATIPVPVPTG